MGGVDKCARRAPRPEQLSELLKTHSSALQQEPITERNIYKEFTGGQTGT